MNRKKELISNLIKKTSSKNKTKTGMTSPKGQNFV